MRLRDRAVFTGLLHCRAGAANVWKFLRCDRFARRWHWYLLHLGLGVIGVALLINVSGQHGFRVGSQEKLGVTDTAVISRSEVFVGNRVEDKNVQLVFIERSPIKFRCVDEGITRLIYGWNIQPMRISLFRGSSNIGKKLLSYSHEAFLYGNLQFLFGCHASRPAVWLSYNYPPAKVDIAGVGLSSILQ